MIFAMISVGQSLEPNNELTEDQVLELAHQRAIAAGFIDGKTVNKPSLGEGSRIEYSTICTFPHGSANWRQASVIVCSQQATIIYDGDKGVINLNPQTLKIVPELLQSMPPGTDLYITVVEEAAKIDQMIFWLDQGRLYPEATNK